MVSLRKHVSWLEFKETCGSKDPNNEREERMREMKVII